MRVASIIEQADTDIGLRRHSDGRAEFAVDRSQWTEAAAAACSLIGVERQEHAAGHIDAPVAHYQNPFRIEGDDLIAVDDQDTAQAARQLLGGIAVRVEEKGAGVGRREIVSEGLTGLDRRLRDMGTPSSAIGRRMPCQ